MVLGDVWVGSLRLGVAKDFIKLGFLAKGGLSWSERVQKRLPCGPAHARAGKCAIFSCNYCSPSTRPRCFFAPVAGTNVDPLVPALEKIWADSMGQSLADFNFR